MGVSSNNEYLAYYNDNLNDVVVFQNTGGTFSFVARTSTSEAFAIRISDGGTSMIWGDSPVLKVTERDGTSFTEIQSIFKIEAGFSSTATQYSFSVSTDHKRLVWYNNNADTGVDIRVFERNSLSTNFTEVTQKNITSFPNQQLPNSSRRPAACDVDCNTTATVFEGAQNGATGYNLYVFERDGGSWTRTVLPQPPVAGTEGPPYDTLTVSLNAAGDMVAFGDYQFTTGGTQIGRVLFYSRDGGGTWSYHSEYRNIQASNFFAYELKLQPEGGPAAFVFDGDAGTTYYIVYNGTQWNVAETYPVTLFNRMDTANGGHDFFLPNATGASWYTRGYVFGCSDVQPLSSSQKCRSGTQQCEADAFCSGTGTGCPANGFKSAGTPCTPSANSTIGLDVQCFVGQCPGDSFNCTLSTIARNSAPCDAGASRKRELPSGTCELADECLNGLCIENAGTRAFDGCNVGGTVHATFPCVVGRRCVAMLAEG